MYEVTQQQTLHYLLLTSLNTVFLRKENRDPQIVKEAIPI